MNQCARPAHFSARPTATTPPAPAAKAATSRTPWNDPPTSAGMARTGPKTVPDARWKVAPAERARNVVRRPAGNALAPRLMATPTKTPLAVVCWIWIAWCLLRNDEARVGRRGCDQQAQDGALDDVAAVRGGDAAPQPPAGIRSLQIYWFRLCSSNGSKMLHSENGLSTQRQYRAYCALWYYKSDVERAHLMPH